MSAFYLAVKDETRTWIRICVEVKCENEIENQVNTVSTAHSVAASYQYSKCLLHSRTALNNFYCCCCHHCHLLLHLQPYSERARAYKNFAIWWQLIHTLHEYNICVYGILVLYCYRYWQCRRQFSTAVAIEWKEVKLYTFRFWWVNSSDLMMWFFLLCTKRAPNLLVGVFFLTFYELSL